MVSKVGLKWISILKMTIIFLVFILWINLTLVIGFTYNINFNFINIQQWLNFFIPSFCLIGLLTALYFVFLGRSIKLKITKLIFLELHLPLIATIIFIIASEIFIFIAPFTFFPANLNINNLLKENTLLKDIYNSFWIIFTIFDIVLLIYIPILLRNVFIFSFFNFPFSFNIEDFDIVNLKDSWLNFYLQLFIIHFAQKWKNPNYKQNIFDITIFYKNWILIQKFKHQRVFLIEVLNLMITTVPLLITSLNLLLSDDNSFENQKIVFGISFGAIASGFTSFLVWIINFNKKRYNLKNFNNLYFKSLNKFYLFKDVKNDEEFEEDNDILKTPTFNQNEENKYNPNELIDLSVYNFFELKNTSKEFF